MAVADPGGAAFVLREVVAEDRPVVLELLRLTLGEKEATRKSEEYWRWKHELNPFGASYAVCAEAPDARTMAGLRTMMRWVFTYPGGPDHSAARAVDTATHPEYQRRGIFSTLTRRSIDALRREGNAFIFNTPNQNSLPGYLKMGWRVVERWPIYARLVRPVGAAWKALSGRGAGETVPTIESAGMIPWSRFFEAYRGELGALVSGSEQHRRQVGFRTRRSLEYLDWRYGAHPNIGYGVHPSLNGAGRLEGFLIARPARGVRGLTTLLLTDLFLHDPSPAAACRLLRSAFRHVRCDYWTAHFSTGTNERAALARLGFVAVPGRGYTWTALPLNHSSADPAAAGSWDLTLGELEIF